MPDIDWTHWRIFPPLYREVILPAVPDDPYMSSAPAQAQPMTILWCGKFSTPAPEPETGGKDG